MSITKFFFKLDRTWTYVRLTFSSKLDSKLPNQCLCSCCGIGEGEGRRQNQECIKLWLTGYTCWGTGQMTETYRLGDKGLPLMKNILRLVYVILQSGPQPKGFVALSQTWHSCCSPIHFHPTRNTVVYPNRLHRRKLCGFACWILALT